MDKPWHILLIDQALRGPYSEYPETRVRDEIKRGLGLKAYVPVERRQMQFTHRCRVLEVPLITGYVFVSGGRHGIPWRDVRELVHVRGWFKREDERPYQLSDLDVQLIQQFEHDHNKGLYAPKGAAHSFQPGDRVREPAGPFGGSVEYLLRSVKDMRVQMEAELNGMKITRETTADQLERVA